MINKKIVCKLFILSTLLTSASVFAAQTVVYPNQDTPIFSVTAPEDWEFTAAENESEYFTLANEEGTTLYFRAIEGNEESLTDALSAGIDYLKTVYSKVEMSEPLRDSHQGNPMLYSLGKGSDEDGNEYYFGFGFIALPSGLIGEVWFEASIEDEEGIKTSDEILKTFNAF